MSSPYWKSKRLNKQDAEPLFEQLEKILREGIETERLKPGDRIPSESELVLQFKISRMTVRRALDLLAVTGTIVRKPGKGVFVSRGKLDYNPTTVFSFSTTLRAMGHSVQTLVIDQRIVPAPHDVAQHLGLPDASPIILVRRLRSVDQQPAVLMASFLPPKYYEGILGKNLQTLPLGHVMEQVSGLVITKTDDSFESALVRSDEAALLGVKEPLPVLLVRGVAYTASGLAVRSTKSIYRGDLFRFQINPQSGLMMRIEQPILA